MIQDHSAYGSKWILYVRAAHLQNDA